ncbi:hypothetical protein [Leclercia sp.]|uniref:hypothetical protein n=1 Tax=Leclercia sp. TaxID=1898428 RepID=UPI002FDE379F
MEKEGQSQEGREDAKQKGRRFLVSPCCIWWPLLDLNQRPSDYELSINILPKNTF